MIDLPPDLAQCAPQVSPVLMQALVRTESAWNPYAIGPDAGQRAIAQPQTLDEAVKTVKQLQAAGAKFSVGLAQIHISNVTGRGMTWEQAFDGSMPFCVELDNLKDTDAPIHQPAAMLVAAD